MNLLRLSSLLLAPALAASFALACGEISDPTKNGERTATVSGALTGTAVPAGARVAIVWRNGAAGGVVGGAEAEIVSGKFTMALTPPPDAYFFPMTGNDYDSLNDAPNVATPEPMPAPSGGSDGDGTDPGGGSSGTPPSGGSSGGAKIAAALGKIGTRTTNVSGGITEPLAVATAGFVVYVDGNGNGKLDLEGEYASSPDQILGGNKELILAYLKGGGQLDYEKLRDKSGILPNAGYNLAWDEGRWLPLSLVELQLNDKAKLPSAVCQSSGSFSGESSGGSGGSMPKPETEEAAPTTPRGGNTEAPDGGYPAAGDPKVYCYDDGRSFYYTGDCPPPPPAPVGLCANYYGESTIACASASYSFAGDDPPAGWPCPVTGSGGSSGSSGEPIDGGAAPDAGGI